MKAVASGLAALFALALLSAPAEAQRRRRQPAAPADPMQAAEQAYTDVDFERTLEHAGAALQAGHHPPALLTRIYMLLGVSAAALGDPDGARDFFQRMLVVDPDAALDDTVPPRLRAPYLEARGIVSARPEPLGVEVTLLRPRSALRVALTDPFEMAHTVRVHARLQGALEYTSIDLEAADEMFATLPGAGDADRVEYWIEVLDLYGNQLRIVGSEIEPRIVGRPAEPPLAPAGDATAAPAARAPSIVEEPLFWVAVVGGAVVLGAAIGIGVAAERASHVPVQLRSSFGVE